MLWSSELCDGLEQRCYGPVNYVMLETIKRDVPCN